MASHVAHVPEAAAIAGVALVVLLMLPRVVKSLLTLRALAFVPLVSRRLAPWLRARVYSDDELFSADGASPVLADRRRRGLDRLATTLRSSYQVSAAWEAGVRGGFSDLRFTDASRVPFPFARAMRERFNLCTVVTASRGPYLETLDGNWTLDVSGSYGLNVAGFDRYKAWIDRGWDRVRALGPVLGPLHPVVADNIRRLKRFSGLDEVSFHMSGTEAVMAAIRLARFNTRRRLVVVFSGAYHGWWDGVQPGLGSERLVDDCLALKDLDLRSLAVIRARASEIAAVVVNPVQAFHPNSPPPNDAVLLTSQARTASASTASYTDWLARLRDVCSGADVPLIFDEVYTGFRLAPGGAQEYFRIAADMVVYGKTVGGGLPIGVVCGTSRLMRRTDPDHPMRMAYVVGTFSGHPLVMGAMNEFLRWVEHDDTALIYNEGNQRCTDWARSTNATLARESLPVRVVNLATVWTVLFTESSRYNWLLQYYLRAEGLTLSWVGTGRCLASLDFTPDDYQSLETRIVNAARQMSQDGWWPTAAEFPERDHMMKKRLIGDVLQGLVPKPIRAFYAAVMRRKDDDHHASHNNLWNQYLHLVSSSVFIYGYATIATHLTAAMWLGVTALLVRQFGHAILEPACHDEEALLLGYNTPTKTLILFTYLLLPLAVVIRTDAWTLSALVQLADPIAVLWFWFTLVVVGARVAVLTFKHSFGIAMVWLVKLLTDPFTDLIAYFPWRTERA